MQTLERLLAGRVLEALEAQEHIIVTPGGTDALLDEVAGIIAPTAAALKPRRQSPPRTATAAVAHAATDEADPTLAAMVDEIAERLMDSDHVDDIFADDRVIRRDAFRAAHDALRRYAEQRVELDDGNGSSSTWTARLGDMGYLVSTVVQRAEPSLLVEALQSSAATVGARFLGLDVADCSADFDLNGASANTKLALEEAITERMDALVAAGLVELPCVDQLLKLPRGVRTRPGFQDALAEVAAQVREHTGCEVAWALIESQTLLATLTPFTDEQADSADEHLDYLLAELSRALSALEPNKTGKRARRAKRAELSPQPARRRRNAKSVKRSVRKAAPCPEASSSSKRPAARHRSGRASTPQSNVRGRCDKADGMRAAPAKKRRKG